KLVPPGGDHRSDGAALVLPGEPAGHAEPARPSGCGGAVDIDARRDPVEGLILTDRVIDREDREVIFGTTVHHRDAAALILPGEPVGHVDPPGPVAGDVAVRVQRRADLVDAAVLAGRIVDHEDDEVLRAVAVEVGQRDAAALVLEREPAGHVDPPGPAAGDVAVRVQRPADLVDAAVEAGRIGDHEGDEVLRAAAVEVGQRDAAALVLEREPAGHVDPPGPAAGDVAVRVQRPADLVDA